MTEVNTDSYLCV